MDEPRTVDSLAPEARFALRAVAAGLAIDDVSSILRLDSATVRKHLRSAARGLGAATPPPSEGDAALLAALTSSLATARGLPSRTPSKGCPDADVAGALAQGVLDGPLMLAEAEHAADCPACLARLVALRKSGALPKSDVGAAVASPRRSPWPVVVGVAVGLAAAAWYLLS